MEEAESACQLTEEPGSDSTPNRYMVVEERIETQHLQDDLDSDEFSALQGDHTPLLVTCGTLIIRTQGSPDIEDSKEDPLKNSMGPHMKAVKELENHEQQSDAFIRGDNGQIRPCEFPQVTQDSSSIEMKAEQLENLCTLKGTLENRDLSEIFTVVDSASPDKSQSGIQPSMEITSPNLADDIVEKDEDSESHSALSVEGSNVLDQPLFPDFSLSVLRFQEAIESFTQAVFNDAFDSLVTDEEKVTEREDRTGQRKNETKDLLHQNHLYSCELSGENTVEIVNSVEPEEIEECFEALTVSLCTTDTVNESSLDPLIPMEIAVEGDEVQQDYVADKEFRIKEVKTSGLLDNAYSEQELKKEGSEVLTVPTTWTTIPIHRAHSDSSSVGTKNHSLTITDVSSQEFTDVQMNSSPVVQEEDEVTVNKTQTVNITIEDISSYTETLSSDNVFPGNKEWPGEPHSCKSAEEPLTKSKSSEKELHLPFERKIEEVVTEEVLEVPQDTAPMATGYISQEILLDSSQLLCTKNPEVLKYECNISELSGAGTSNSSEGACIHAEEEQINLSYQETQLGPGSVHQDQIESRLTVPVENSCLVTVPIDRDEKALSEVSNEISERENVVTMNVPDNQKIKSQEQHEQLEIFVPPLEETELSINLDTGSAVSILLGSQSRVQKTPIFSSQLQDVSVSEGNCTQTNEDTILKQSDVLAMLEDSDSLANNLNNTEICENKEPVIEASDSDSCLKEVRSLVSDDVTNAGRDIFDSYMEPKTHFESTYCHDDVTEHLLSTEKVEYLADIEKEKNPTASRNEESLNTSNEDLFGGEMCEAVQDEFISCRAEIPDRSVVPSVTSAKSWLPFIGMFVGGALFISLYLAPSFLYTPEESGSCSHEEERTAAPPSSCTLEGYIKLSRMP